MKKGVLIAALLLSVIFIIALLFFIPEKNICGPKGAGGGRSPEYCDKSCEVDSDCVYTCGCDLINKNEKCDMGGVFIECIQRHSVDITCVNHKCTYLIPQVIE